MAKRIDASKMELIEKVVEVNRVTKTVKGGRNMRFAVTVAVGDGKGHVGIGQGKSAEIPDAMRKASEDAKKHMIDVSHIQKLTAKCIIHCIQLTAIPIPSEIP